MSIVKEIANINFLKILYGDGRSGCVCINLSKNFETILYIQVTVCFKCGNYSYTEKSNEEKIYCKCVDTFGKRCKEIHMKKLSIVLDELIANIDTESETENMDIYDFVACIGPSRYDHNGSCFPNKRKCSRCWRYWCGTCGGGVGGMMGLCYYKKCRAGRKNLGI